jgi:hypothetical protein
MDQNRDDYDDKPNWKPVVRGHGLRKYVVPLLIACVPAACAGGFLAGWLSESIRMYREKSRHDQAVFTPVLAADPAFSKVEIHPHSAGGILLWGEVATPADGARLRAEFVRLFGETEAWRIEVLVRQTGTVISEPRTK